MSAGEPMVRWVRQVALRPGSTRSASLMRIGLALIVWARFGNDMTYHHAVGTPAMVLPLFWAATAAMLVGWRSRLSCAATAAVLWGLYVWRGVVLDDESWRSHHMYALALPILLLALSPCGGSFSVDRWLGLRRAASRGAPVPREHGDSWVLSLIAFQVSVIYVAGGLGRLEPRWLMGDRFEQLAMYLYTGSDYPTLPGFAFLAKAMAVGSAAFEVALGLALWRQRRRLAWMLAGVLFHGLIYVTLPVATFSITMPVLYLAFFDVDAVHRFLGGPVLLDATA